MLAISLALDLAAGTIMFALLCAAVCIPLGLVRLLRSTADSRWRASLALAFAVFAPVAAISAVIMNAAHARAVRGDVVTAVEAFHAREGRWPRDLVELVPRDLPSYPRAKFTLVLAGFDYFNFPPPPGSTEPDHGPILYYVVYPPFMRSSYSFEGGSSGGHWKTID